MNGSVLIHLAVLAASWVLIVPGTAWAYIDPGTGSYLFQLLIAGGLAGLYTLRRYWQNVKAAVGGLFGRAGGRSDGVD